jgi:hypothetical protein
VSQGEQGLPAGVEAPPLALTSGAFGADEVGQVVRVRLDGAIADG